MPSKDFEQPIISFYEVRDPNGNIIAAFPIVEVSLTPPQGQPLKLPLLFDTGASITTLSSDLSPLLGLTAWNVGRPIQTDGIGGRVTGYLYTYQLEVFGKVIPSCPIQLIDMRFEPLFVGLLGRESVFTEFGFGFWERTRELLVTNNP